MIVDTFVSRLLVLNEQIEILDAAIDFKNHSVALRNAVIKKDGNYSSHASSSGNSSVKNKLDSLNHDDLRHLFQHCFDKVLRLRLEGEENGHGLKALGVELEEERERRWKVELALHQARLDTERLLTSQQLVSGRVSQWLDFPHQLVKMIKKSGELVGRTL